MSTSAVRPPRRWEIHTWTLLGLAGASALAGLVTLVTLVGVRNEIATNGTSGTSVLVELSLKHASLVDQIYFVLVLAYLVAFYWWRSESRRLLTMFGDPSAKALRHWTIGAWNVLIFISFVIRFVASTGTGNSYGADADPVGEALSKLDTTITGLAVRLAGLGLLIAGVWLVRGQIHQTLANSFSTPPPPAPAPPVRPVTQPPSILDTTAMPTADDAFWDRVRALSYAADSDLAMLESTSNLIRRWSLIPTASSVAGIRASLPAGAVITVFPTPPQPGALAPTQPPTDEASEWYGLTEDAGTGMLWFQLLLPSRVPSWLTKAKSAHRYGLYRADDPAALTAVVRATGPVPPAPTLSAPAFPTPALRTPALPTPALPTPVLPTPALPAPASAAPAPAAQASDPTAPSAASNSLA